MGNVPSVELLESTHEFPGPYLIKAIGRSGDEFVERVVEVVCQDLTQGSEFRYELRHTSGGRHVAVTLEPHVVSAESVIAIYQRLQDVDGLVMLL